MIRLPLVLETGPLAFADPRNPVGLVPETRSRGLLGDYSSLYGYQLRLASLWSTSHLYATSFGTARDNRYSRIVLQVDYGPQPWAMFTQWILPMLLVMTLVLLLRAWRAASEKPAWRFLPPPIPLSSTSSTPTGTSCRWGCLCCSSGAAISWSPPAKLTGSG